MLLIGIGVWLLVVILIIMFFRGASEKEVILRPLDMKRSNLETNLFDEMRKCYEEDEEFHEAILKYDIDNAIEEFWDSVQTKLNVMSMIKIPVELVYRGLDKHIAKMNERGYVFKE
ncbi:hypothetical protein PMY56_13540 [Clostridium tertium]|uniref:hypothetical protein n=1 Tax=Clostridium tertium TaxID=1559 RepID=UPI00232E5413|nr:hypothetical protein [Clostridium tertium]MDB1924079.1 hypothetical protein [Clostridium tertium]MDB1927160.1 hypothetical protein [Clostridium tertium]MDB1930937.1 hypothetical protein [Clostridium tertium]